MASAPTSPDRQPSTRQRGASNWHNRPSQPRAGILWCWGGHRRGRAAR